MARGLAECAETVLLPHLGRASIASRPALTRAQAANARLGERAEPYPLAVELGRRRLNELRNQLADWKQRGLRAGADLDGIMATAHQAFVKAVTAGENPDEAFAAAQACLAAAWAAG